VNPNAIGLDSHHFLASPMVISCEWTSLPAGINPGQYVKLTPGGAAGAGVGAGAGAGAPPPPGDCSNTMGTLSCAPFSHIIPCAATVPFLLAALIVLERQAIYNTSARSFVRVSLPHDRLVVLLRLLIIE
jgi:hypothetical protein